MPSLTLKTSTLDAGDGDFSHLEEAIAAPSGFDLSSVSVKSKHRHFDEISMLMMADLTHVVCIMTGGCSCGPSF